MDKKEYNLDVVEKISRIKLPANRQFKLKVGSSTYQIKLVEEEENQQSSLIRESIIPVLSGSLVFFILAHLTKQSSLPIVGNDSISSFVILIGAITTFILLCGNFISEKKKKAGKLKKLSCRNFITILLAFTLISVFFLLGFFWLLGIAFKDARFDCYTATLFAFIILAITDYGVLLTLQNFSSGLITNLLIIVIISGVVFSIIMNQNSHWWQINLSFLGSHAAKYSWQFNFTLILSALLLVALIDYLFIALKKKFPHNHRLSLLRFTLTLTALSLAGVGLFPNIHGTIYHQIHDNFAFLMVYLIFLQIILIKWLLPQVTKTFLITSYVMSGLILIAAFLWRVLHYFSLTAFEIVGFILAFSWLLLLIQNLEYLSREKILTFSLPLTNRVKSNKS